MPIFEYKCSEGHVFEFFFKTFKESEGINRIACHECLLLRRGEPRRIIRIAERVEFSTPSEAMFYGNPEGYAKPSATKRHSTKLVSSLEGNSSAVG